jgi:ketosteroid isomerase-like protein
MNAEAEAVVETVRSMFAAATVDDFERLAEMFDDGFYAFDMERRLDGMALLALIRDAHAAGTIIVWSVTEPEVHVEGDLAWMTHVNRGSISNSSGVAPATWLESAVLGRRNGRWRIRFFHSTRLMPQREHV